MSEGPRPLWQIATEIEHTWGRVSRKARPHLNALHRMYDTTEMYYGDSAKGIIRYFLAASQDWKGPDALRIKAELQTLIDTEDEVSEVSKDKDALAAREIFRMRIGVISPPGKCQAKGGCSAEAPIALQVEDVRFGKTVVDNTFCTAHLFAVSFDALTYELANIQQAERATNENKEA